MSMLIRLYPRAWRDRYETEILDLLVERPGSVRDAVDLARGAADAHLHPQGGPPIPWTWRLPGVVVLATGLLWLAALVAAVGGADLVTGTLVGLGLFTMFVGLPGDYMAPWRRHILLGIGSFVITFGLANALGWEAGTPFALAAFTILFGGSLILAAVRAELGATTRRRFMTAFFLLPAMGSVVLAAGFAQSPVLVALYPVGWVVLGLRLIVRGSRTLIDAPEPTSPGVRLDQEISA